MLRHQTVTRKVTFSGQGAHRLSYSAQNIFKRDAKNQHATRSFPKKTERLKSVSYIMRPKVIFYGTASKTDERNGAVTSPTPSTRVGQRGEKEEARLRKRFMLYHSPSCSSVCELRTSIGKRRETANHRNHRPQAPACRASSTA